MSKSRGLFNLQSLQVRITLGVLVVSLLALWSAVLILDRTLRRDMESSISAQQFSAVSLIAAELDRSIGERQQIVKTIPDNYRSTLLSDSPAAQAALEQYPLPDSIFNWGLIILDKQGVAVASVPRDIKRTGVSFLRPAGERPASLPARDRGLPGAAASAPTPAVPRGSAPREKPCR